MKRGCVSRNGDFNVVLLDSVVVFSSVEYILHLGCTK